MFRYKYINTTTNAHFAIAPSVNDEGIWIQIQDCSQNQVRVKLTVELAIELRNAIDKSLEDNAKK